MARAALLRCNCTSTLVHAVHHVPARGMNCLLQRPFDDALNRASLHLQMPFIDNNMAIPMVKVGILLAFQLE